MKLTSYALLEDGEDLNRLCFRAGYVLEEIIYSSELFGKDIINRIGMGLGIRKEDLYVHISKNKKYRYYEVTVSDVSRFKSWLGSLFRGMIGGVLLTSLKIKS